MTPSSASPDPGRDQEALRRQLYRPGATAHDVEAYRALTDADHAEEEPATAPPTRHRRPLVPIAVGTAVAVLVVAATVTARTTAPTASPTSSRAEPTSGVITELPISRPGSGASIQVFRGTGKGVVALEPVVAHNEFERLALRITLDAKAVASWTAGRAEPRFDGDSAFHLLASGGRALDSRNPVSWRYEGLPPTTLRMHVPDGVGWRIVVVSGA